MECEAGLYYYLGAIAQEYDRACVNFAAFHSAHEGLAVLQEEFEELKAEVFKSKFKNGHNDNLARMKEEAVQVAAMALRFLTDVK